MEGNAAAAGVEEAAGTEGVGFAVADAGAVAGLVSSATARDSDPGINSATKAAQSTAAVNRDNELGLLR
jgi:hypothetical protein